jgi:hypothetical protein
MFNATFNNIPVIESGVKHHFLFIRTSRNTTFEYFVSTLNVLHRNYTWKGSLRYHKNWSRQVEGQDNNNNSLINFLGSSVKNLQLRLKQ